MISFPNAKINLGLNVVSKRPDGYHNIETIFYPIPVKDALEIVRADTFSFTQTGIPVDVPIEKNLVVKALNLLKSRYKIPELEVHLLKAIPFGAGPVSYTHLDVYKRQNRRRQDGPYWRSSHSQCSADTSSRT